MNSHVSTGIDFEIWSLMHQARDAVFKVREKELRQYGITGREAAVLFTIQSIGDRATPAEISRWLFREHHTVSVMLRRMEQRGLITRTKDLINKNTWLIGLTEKGQDAYRNSMKRESIYTVMSTLSKHERQVLASCLRKVRDQALKSSLIKPTIPFP